MRCIGSHSSGRTKAFVKKNVGVFVFCLFKKNTVLCAIMGLPEEHDLIASLKRGDEKAWRYLYERHYVVLCKIAYDFVSDSFWAESIVEDAIFHLWEIRKEVEIRESLRSYLVGAVRNRCLNHLHSAQNRCETCFSKSALRWINFSFTSSSLFFLITSASFSASRSIDSYLDFKRKRIVSHTSKPPRKKVTIDMIIYIPI